MNNLKNRSAFTMVEICLVCGIIFISLVPVFRIMSQGSSTTIYNRNEILAQQYASNLIAYCNAVPFDNEYLTDTEGKSVPLLMVKDKEEKIEDKFTRTLSVSTYLDDVSNRKYKLVSVKVEWKESGEANKHNVIMAGMVSEQ